MPYLSTQRQELVWFWAKLRYQDLLPSSLHLNRVRSKLCFTRFVSSCANHFTLVSTHGSYPIIHSSHPIQSAFSKSFCLSIPPHKAWCPKQTFALCGKLIPIDSGELWREIFPWGQFAFNTLLFSSVVNCIA